ESRQDLYDIDYDIQEASGSYVIFNMVNAYQSIQNVVVKFSAKDSNSTNYLLINSHYDTVAESAGAGDAGVMITTMLEVLRKISKSSNTLRHPIIFLFNGAEENPLQGSHAFINQHKWANNIKALINLDSAGSGGREILFQSGPNHPWLMKYYKRCAKHPYASTIGEELFQHNFSRYRFPSFRLRRDSWTGHGSHHQ
uniref:FXNA-like protease n=1 Tax=Megaselia scalaris TaxID=36166 RepID=T1H709_MEGSC